MHVWHRYLSLYGQLIGLEIPHNLWTSSYNTAPGIFLELLYLMHTDNHMCSCFTVGKQGHIYTCFLVNLLQCRNNKPIFTNEYLQWQDVSRNIMLKLKWCWISATGEYYYQESWSNNNLHTTPAYIDVSTTKNDNVTAIFTYLLHLPVKCLI